MGAIAAIELQQSTCFPSTLQFSLPSLLSLPAANPYQIKIPKMILNLIRTTRLKIYWMQLKTFQHLSPPGCWRSPIPRRRCEDQGRLATSSRRNSAKLTSPSLDQGRREEQWMQMTTRCTTSST